IIVLFFFSSRRRHTRFSRDWSSDVCSSDLNPDEGYALKTEWIVGVMGPEACAGEVQTWFHDLIGHHRPMGWHHQMPTALLLNLNLGYEKLLFSPGRALEVLGGGEMYMGTMYIGMAFQSTIRFGKMTPYFDGFVNRFTGRRKLQAYFIIKPQLSLVFHNTLLEGSLFRRDYSRGSDDGLIVSESESNTLVPGI